MRIRSLLRLSGALLGVMFFVTLSYPQVAAEDIALLKQNAPKVYIDCERCDQDYIRTEIPFVNYVRDRKEADVHVLITTQSTGSGGTEYTISFIGQGSFSTIGSTLIYASNKTDTQEEIRRGYVSVIKMGLLPYVALTPICDLITISFKEKVSPTDVIDRWKFWVFSASLGAEIDKESQTRSNQLDARFAANKTTPEIKIRLGIGGELESDFYDYDEGTISRKAETGAFSGLIARSLGEHWSAGFTLGMNTSTFRNIRFNVIPAPVLEYDLFPYSESTRRQLRFQYRLGFEHVRYRNETIYEKTRESLLGQALSVALEIKEPWGSLSASLEGSHYFHNVKFNRLEFDSELSFRIFKGLDLNIDARYERIRDQLSLQKGDRTLEEILLRQKELATEYELRFSVNLSYTFGSIFSNVVNPRFGSLGSLRF